MAQNYSYQPQASIANVQNPLPTSTTTNNVGGDDNNSTLGANTEMEIELEAMWAKVNLEIQRIDPNKREYWKVQSLPLARIKKIMKIEEFVLQELEKEQQKQQQQQQHNQHQSEVAGLPITDISTDGRTDASINNDTTTPPLDANDNATGMDGTDYNSGSNGFDNSVDNNNNNNNSRVSNGINSDTGIKFMISSEAPVLVTKACEIFIQEISTRAWKHTDRNRRRTLQRSDVYAALSECETFDFLIDFIPRSNAPAISATPTIMVNAPSVSTIPHNNESSQLSTPSTVPLTTNAPPQQLLQAPYINNNQYLIAAPAQMILPPNPFAHQTQQYVPTSSANNLYTSSTTTNSATIDTTSIMPPLVLAPPPILNNNAASTNTDNDKKIETDNNNSTITNISYLQQQPVLQQPTATPATIVAAPSGVNPMLFFQPQYGTATIPAAVTPLTGHFLPQDHTLTVATTEAISTATAANKINNDSGELLSATTMNSHDQQQRQQTQQQQNWE